MGLPTGTTRVEVTTPVDRVCDGYFVPLPISSAAAAARPYFRYNVGTTNMFSSVEVVSPHRITIAIGV